VLTFLKRRRLVKRRLSSRLSKIPLRTSTRTEEVEDSKKSETAKMIVELSVEGDIYQRFISVQYLQDPFSCLTSSSWTNQRRYSWYS
jgi:hypothetical protein